MAGKSQPTNAELLKEIKQVQATLRDHNTRLNAVEYWKLMVEAHEQALKQVKQEEREAGSSVINKELLKALGLALTALVSLAAFIQASK